ncbi:phosphonate ABC transporter ATP-binding protein [Polynucleobacter yangtzensis]|uniref:Phosphonates import ATP-binding protein PhnC 1 n=1 Tax=Polynucleobacter yangtzensis TaxID=1743159 RepID=A0ABN6TUM2_9BURK|nr:ATP-binding cassette domain-containing protein [Polynucleobacter yangtzensis]BDT79610.1 phosphonates import ATP-binding protein PhnC 1 [Polynucleobacter yangtzensis]
MKKTAFSFDRVSFSHSNGKEALRNINISASAGEAIAIIGSSGSGKTSLLSLIATSLRPSSGSISVLNIDPWAISKRQLQRLRSQIGLVHQAAPIPPKQRVITAVLAGRLGQWPLWRSLLSLIYPVDIAGPESCLEKLGLADRLFDRCDRLSGGQLQRVGVARVLYQRPNILLADEPVSAMDPVLSDVTIQCLLEDARTRDACFVASLHAVDIALRWFPRIIGLRDGEVFFDLPAAQVSEDLLKQLYASERGVLPKQGSANI